LAALLVIGFTGYRNFRHRHALARQQDQLQQQRIRVLEKDQLLVATDAMLKAQEEERSRMAKDLHDGLGGLLSGVKFSLVNMKDHMLINKADSAVFDRSLDMLDTSIRELRRVAHNMMPEALVKFGLDEALKDYCNAINTANLMRLQYQSFGLEERMDQSVEIIVYRVIQELLNNALKHASATEALVQVMRRENRLSITVEDNGKGFDMRCLEYNKGAGWTNIYNRVNYLKGKIDLSAQPGKGVSVNIELIV
jgi:signal transduction histidine kinase